MTAGKGRAFASVEVESRGASDGPGLCISHDAGYDLIDLGTEGGIGVMYDERVNPMHEAI